MSWPELRQGVWKTLFTKPFDDSLFWDELKDNVADAREKRLVEIAEKAEKYFDRGYIHVEKRVDNAVLAEVNQEMERCLLFFTNYLQERPHLKILGELGSGGFGTVLLALDMKKKRLHCLKIVNLLRVEEQPGGAQLRMATRSKNQMKWLQPVFHPSILEVYDVFSNDSVAVLQLEYFPGRNLTSCWSEVTQKWTVAEKLLLLKKVIEGCKCLHNARLVHRDLHVDNVLIDIVGDHDCKLVDFDFAKQIPLNQTSRNSLPDMGHKEIRPPRSPDTDEFKDDIYALGVLGYKLLTGQVDEHRCYNYASLKDTVVWPAGLIEATDPIALVLLQCLSALPQERPTANDLLVPFRDWYQQAQDAQKEICKKCEEKRGLLIGQLLLMKEKKADGEIRVDTNDGPAIIHSRHGKLHVEYGASKGKQALQYLTDSGTIIRDVDLREASPDAATTVADGDDGLEEILASLAGENTGTVGQARQGNEKRRQEFYVYIRAMLEIEESEETEVICENCGDTFPLGNLVCGRHIFLYGEDRDRLMPHCQTCIKKIANKKKPASGRALLGPKYHGYDIVYLYENDCCHFYLGFYKNAARLFLVYDNNCGHDGERWKKTVKRLKRGYYILGNHPSRYFTHFKQNLFSAPVDCKNELPPLAELEKPRLAELPGLRHLFAQRGYPISAQTKVSRTHEQDGWMISGEPWRPEYLLYEEPVEENKSVLEVYDNYFRPVRPSQGKTEGFVILSMEYFPGICLRQFLAAMQDHRITMSPGLHYYILHELAQALEILHSYHIVHRNLNPYSILLGLNGQVKLSDFSMAKYDPDSPAAEDYYSITMSLSKRNPNQVAGYQCPNDLRDSKSNDIWCWGSVAYELLSPAWNRVPEELRNLVQRARKHDVKSPLTATQIVSALQAFLKHQ